MLMLMLMNHSQVMSHCCLSPQLTTSISVAKLGKGKSICLLTFSHTNTVSTLCSAKFRSSLIPDLNFLLLSCLEGHSFS